MTFVISVLPNPPFPVLAPPAVHNPGVPVGPVTFDPKDLHDLGNDKPLPVHNPPPEMFNPVHSVERADLPHFDLFPA